MYLNPINNCSSMLGQLLFVLCPLLTRQRIPSWDSNAQKSSTLLKQLHELNSLQQFHDFQV